MSTPSRSEPGNVRPGEADHEHGVELEALRLVDGHHLDADPLARRHALAPEPDLRQPLQPRRQAGGVEARLALGDLAAQALQGGEAREPRRPLRAARGDRRGAQPGPVDGHPQRVGGPLLGRRAPDLVHRRRQPVGAVRAGHPVEGARHRPLRRRRGGDRVGEGRPRDAVPRVGADAQVLLHRRRVARGPQPGDGGAHLAALEQADAAAHLVRHAGALQRLDDGPRLQPHRAHEHRLLLERHALPRQGHDPLDHGAGLALRVGRPPEPHRRPGRVRQRDAPLRRPVGDRLDHRGGRVEDVLGGPVVDLEPQLRRLGEPAPEVEDVLGRGPAEAVDALVVVADHHQAPAGGGDGVEQLGLGVVRVLELVHQDVGRARLGRLAPVGVRPQQVEGPDDREAEVLQARLGEPAVVRLVHPRELQLAPRPVGRPARGRVRDGRLGPAAVRLRGDELVAAGVDALDQVLDEPGEIAAQVVDAQVELVEAVEQHEHPVLLPRDGHGRQQAPLDAVDPRELLRVGVERGDPERLVRAPEQLLGAVAQLHGGLARERQRQHLGGVGAALHEPRQAAAQDPRLAGACAGEHDRRTAGMGDGRALLRGEIVRHGTPHGTPGPGRPVSTRRPMQHLSTGPATALRAVGPAGTPRGW